MKARKINTLATTDDRERVGAFINARLLNSCNKQNFGTKQIAKICGMAGALELVCNGEVLINYRKTKATVKVCKPFKITNRTGFALLEGDWEKDGIVKTETAQGVIYSLKKI